MGDLAEPKYVDDKSDNVPVMSKLYDTVGRAFQKSKEFEVSILSVCVCMCVLKYIFILIIKLAN